MGVGKDVVGVLLVVGMELLGLGMGLVCMLVGAW